MMKIPEFTGQFVFERNETHWAVFSAFSCASTSSFQKLSSACVSVWSHLRSWSEQSCRAGPGRTAAPPPAPPPAQTSPLQTPSVRLRVCWDCLESGAAVCGSVPAAQLSPGVTIPHTIPATSSKNCHKTGSDFSSVYWHWQLSHWLVIRPCHPFSQFTFPDDGL